MTLKLRVATGSLILVTACCAASGATLAPKSLDIDKGTLRAHVVLRDVVPMVRPLGRSPGAEPAICVVLSGGFPTVETWATPAYSFTSRPGAAMFLTLVTSYRAAGDSGYSHPVSTGTPIQPDPRAPVGRADVQLPVGEHAALALTITVSRLGYAKVAFRHPLDPARDFLIR